MDPLLDVSVRRPERGITSQTVWASVYTVCVTVTIGIDNFLAVSYSSLVPLIANYSMIYHTYK
jgi:hypothetical protein